MLQGSNLSAITSFYTVSRLLQVIGGKGMFDSVAGVILYPYMASSVRDSIARDSIESIDDAKSIFNQLSDMEKVVSSDPEAEGVERVGCPRDTIHIHRLLQFFLSYRNKKKKEKKTLPTFLRESFVALI